VSCDEEAVEGEGSGVEFVVREFADGLFDNFVWRGGWAMEGSGFGGVRGWPGDEGGDCGGRSVRRFILVGVFLLSFLWIPRRPCYVFGQFFPD